MKMIFSIFLRFAMAAITSFSEQSAIVFVDLSEYVEEFKIVDPQHSRKKSCEKLIFIWSYLERIKNPQSEIQVNYIDLFYRHSTVKRLLHNLRERTYEMQSITDTSISENPSFCGHQQVEIENSQINDTGESASDPVSTKLRKKLVKEILIDMAGKTYDISSEDVLKILENAKNMQIEYNEEFWEDFCKVFFKKLSLRRFNFTHGYDQNIVSNFLQELWGFVFKFGSPDFIVPVIKNMFPNNCGIYTFMKYLWNVTSMSYTEAERYLIVIVFQLAVKRVRKADPLSRVIVIFNKFFATWPQHAEQILLDLVCLISTTNRATFHRKNSCLKNILGDRTLPADILEDVTRSLVTIRQTNSCLFLFNASISSFIGALKSGELDGDGHNFITQKFLSIAMSIVCKLIDLNKHIFSLWSIVDMELISVINSIYEIIDKLYIGKMDIKSLEEFLRNKANVTKLASRFADKDVIYLLNFFPMESLRTITKTNLLKPVLLRIHTSILSYKKKSESNFKGVLVNRIRSRLMLMLVSDVKNTDEYAAKVLTNIFCGKKKSGKSQNVSYPYITLKKAIAFCEGMGMEFIELLDSDSWLNTNFGHLIFFHILDVGSNEICSLYSKVIQCETLVIQEKSYENIKWALCAILHFISDACTPFPTIFEKCTSAEIINIRNKVGSLIDMDMLQKIVSSLKVTEESHDPLPGFANEDISLISGTRTILEAYIERFEEEAKEFMEWYNSKYNNQSTNDTNKHAVKTSITHSDNDNTVDSGNNDDDAGHDPYFNDGEYFGHRMFSSFVD